MVEVSGKILLQRMGRERVEQTENEDEGLIPSTYATCFLFSAQVVEGDDWGAFVQLLTTVAIGRVKLGDRASV